LMLNLFEVVAPEEVSTLPARYRDYAYASLARASGRLGSDYRALVGRVRSPYLRAYVLAEMPLYEPSSLESAVREVLALVPFLRYEEKVYALARLAETVYALGAGGHEEFLSMAASYAPPVGYSGKARLALAFSRCGEVERAIRVAEGFRGSRRASIYVEVALSRPESLELLARGVRLVEKLRDSRKKIVLFSRLARHPRYEEGVGTPVESIAMKVPLGGSLEDVYLSLLVARNLAEAGYAGAARRGFEEVASKLPPVDVLPLDFAELVLEAFYHYRGLQAALRVAEGSSLAPLYYAHLMDYVSMLSFENSLARVTGR